ncbi:hypothetical protein EYF80_001376 [Liparis tanakae]|uniref:Uncharacterized protein n=1 Tax=Liparis tanakae TaxID=230148 RepID=A0A4Z2JFK7_9TELE|nr:hypothetical protein EYF80_001376 [Liparis tanakae]
MYCDHPEEMSRGNNGHLRIITRSTLWASSPHSVGSVVSGPRQTRCMDPSVAPEEAAWTLLTGLEFGPAGVGGLTRSDKATATSGALASPLSDVTEGSKTQQRRVRRTRTGRNKGSHQIPDGTARSGR